MPGKGQVNDSDVGLAHAVVIGKVASGQQRGLHGGEVSGSDRGHLDLHVFVFALVISGDYNVAVIVGIGQVGIVSPCHGARSRQRCERLHYSSVQGKNLLGLVAGEARIDAEAYQVVRSESDIQRAQVVQRAHKQAGADQQQQAQADLHSHQYTAEA